MPLSDTARSILTAASQHLLGLAAPPPALLAAARHAVLRSLLRQGLVAQHGAPAGNGDPGWRQPDGTVVGMQITDAGRQAIGADQVRSPIDEAELGGLTQADHAVEQDLAQPAVDAGAGSSVDVTTVTPMVTGTVPARALTQPHSDSLESLRGNLVGDCGGTTQGAGEPSRALRGASRLSPLRFAAEALLTAWDAPKQVGLGDAIAALRATMVTQASRLPRRPATPRAETKQATVLALLRRPEGASGPQLIEATGWAPHTVRGFLAGLGRKGIAVTVLERVRQIGPNKAGAKGSYTIYRVAEAG